MPTIKDYYLPKRPTLLFSLHPEPTQASMNGTKMREYRRRFFARRIVKSSATFCRRKLHLDFSIPRPCVDGYLNL